MTRSDASGIRELEDLSAEVLEVGRAPIREGRAESDLAGLSELHASGDLPQPKPRSCADRERSCISKRPPFIRYMGEDLEARTMTMRTSCNKRRQRCACRW